MYDAEKALGQVVADAKMEARMFLAAQDDTNHSHGAGWDERALAWLMVKFYKRGQQAVQSSQSTAVEVDGQ